MSEADSGNGEGPFELAVVGGGTAGWLSALFIRRAAEQQGLSIRLTVIESSRIPTIGVGEGTTSVFNEALRMLNIDEFEFLRETGATIKYGIRHKDWRRPGVTYDGPIDDPRLLFARAQRAVNGKPRIRPLWLDQHCVANGRSVTETHVFAHLMAKFRAPFVFQRDNKPVPVSPFLYAYHFDQALAGGFLRRKAEGIEQLDGIVEAARLDGETGRITSLVFRGGEEKNVDFVVDCTGFRRALISREMGAEWVPYGDRLPVNRAMPFWLEHGESDAIAPFTMAEAMRSGWMWQIPTWQRIGCGYVYSDSFVTPEEARTEIENALGREIEPRADIKVDSGRLDRAWIGNCLAVGLSQSFFEPLEATSIHGTIVQLLLFTQFHLKGIVDGRDPDPAKYNSDAARQVDDFCTFINFHYVSERTDTPFWRYVREECIGEEVRERLEQWKARFPQRNDFTRLPGGLPHVGEELYVPVLDGLGLLDRNVAKAELEAVPQLRALARRSAQSVLRSGRIAAARAKDHRQFLEWLHRERADE